ncbi:DNA cytosine methyltransferase [Anaerospora hongkongensis]|uniref:DNA cytosine methyltransferase n=1 Tax=Anaerospora hongkongensis TaxID=244830 RepID=UPI00289DB705|nr:DNA cytosine methyltransferase [Anaerospora hongkongensis]
MRRIYKIGSLFDGLGGFPQAAIKCGMVPVWASEIEEFPIAVTKLRLPDMQHLGDVTKINGTEIEPVDVITFGSPCQDLSVAGKREGMAYKCQECEHKWEYSTTYGIDTTCPECGSENIELTRSNLFTHATRIIREMRDATNGRYPTFAVWENVPGAFSSNRGRDFRAVISELIGSEVPMPQSGQWANAGMVRGDGCSLAWRVFDAQYWGVPQRRRRIYVVVDFGGQRAGEILFEPEGMPGDSEESRAEGQGIADSVKDGVRAAGFIPRNSASARDIGFGIEVAPTLRSCPNEAIVHPKITGTLCSSGAGMNRPAGMASETDLIVAYGVDCRNACENKEFVATLQCGGDSVSLNAIHPIRIGYAVRRLTPLECERLQGLPEGWTDIPGAKDTPRYKAIGNGLAQPCPDWIMDRIKEQLGEVGGNGR